LKKSMRRKTGAPKVPSRIDKKTAVMRKSRARGEPPKTIGELRKMLAKLGDPWRPDPTLSDGEPIPKFPTGGDNIKEAAGKIVPEGRLIEVLKKNPPSNPFLRDTWKKHGLLEEPAQPPRAQRKRLRGDG
jgi:hypothetical protein